MVDHAHFGRSFSGHPLEDACPCPQEPCGLVASATLDPECSQHGHGACKTIRQWHRAEDCPGMDVWKDLERSAEYLARVARARAQDADATVVGSAMGEAVRAMNRVLEMWERPKLVQEPERVF